MVLPVISNVTYKAASLNVSVLGGAPAEALVTIEGLNFDAAAEVICEGVTLFPSLRISSRSGTRLQAILPAVAQMQTSPAYQRNALLTQLTFHVVNPGGGAANTSNGFTFPVVMEPPRVGAKNQYNSVKGTTLYVGDKGPNNDPNAADSLGELADAGKDAAGGQAWFYAVPASPLGGLPSLPTPTGPVPAGGSFAVPAAIATQYAAVRTSGTRLQVADWHDDYAVLDLPPVGSAPWQDGALAGFVILWRDDLPSAVIPVGVVDIGCDKINQLLRTHYALDLDPGSWLNLDPNQPQLNPHQLQLASLVAQPLPWAPGVPKPVTDLLDSLGVRFQFTVDGIPPNHVNQTWGNPGDFLSRTNQGFALLPDFGCAERKADGTTYTITFKLQIQVHVDGCDVFTLECDSKLPPFTLAPLPIPTIAAFFTDANFVGNLLVMLPANTAIQPLRGGHFDDEDDSGNPLDALNGVSGDLSALAILLQLLGAFFPAVLPAAGVLDTLSTLVDRVDGAAHPVVDATGALDDLENAVNVDSDSLFGTDDDFDDAASSLLLLAAPGFGTLAGFTDDGFDDHRVDWTMPVGAIIAAVPNFGNLAAGLPGVPLPYAGDPATGDANDALESIRLSINTPLAP